MKVPGLFSFAAAILLSGSEPQHERQVPQLLAKQVSVNGTTIRYWEQGRGVPVVFVHGAISDHRYWEPQRGAVATRYRFIALDRRYFGPTPWPDTGVRISHATDIADLAAFIRELKIGPTFLVGTSGGAVVALLTAVEHPELVRALFINEPGLRSILTDSADRKLVSEGEGRRDAARAAARAGDMTGAARLFVENANNQPGSFDSLSPEVKAMFVDNARTLSLSPPLAVSVTCGQLGQLKAPVAITKGQLTKTVSRVTAEAAHRCMPQSRLITIPNASHGGPRQNPSAFNEALLEFLARDGSVATQPGRR